MMKYRFVSNGAASRGSSGADVAILVGGMGAKVSILATDTP